MYNRVHSPYPVGYSLRSCVHAGEQVIKYVVHALGMLSVTTRNITTRPANARFPSPPRLTGKNNFLHRFRKW